jgi:hypothetical protein
MISNEAVRDLYQSLDTPGVYDATDPYSLQIFRGKFAYGGKEAPGICQRGGMIFKRFGVIQEYCFQCYKVVVEPRTVMELFKLLILFETLHLPNNNRRKCMTELRPNCSGTYKGYVYCGGLEEGNEVHDLVRKAVSNEISPDISINLKRGCSEYAIAYPEYARVKPGVEPMKYNEAWRVHEEYFDKHARWTPRTPDEPSSTYKPSEIFAMTVFLRYAATIGDDSYLEIAGCALPPIPDLKRPAFVGPTSSSP